MKKAIINQGENQFELLLKLYLGQRDVNLSESATEHLDEDVLTALVEGRLNSPNSLPMISHLVDCSLCRRSTFELVKVLKHFDGEIEVKACSPNKPKAFHQFWANLTDKVFDSGDGAVYAHNESADSDDKQNNEDK